MKKFIKQLLQEALKEERGLQSNCNKFACEYDDSIERKKYYRLSERQHKKQGDFLESVLKGQATINLKIK